MDNSGSTSVSQCANASLSVSAPSYYEVTAWSVAGTIDGAGACGFAAPDAIYPSGGFPGSVSKSFGFSVGGNGNWYKKQDGAASVAIPALNGLTNGTVMMIAYDPVNGRAWVGKNGAWNGSGDPATGTNPDLTGIAADVLIPSLSIFNNGTQSVQWYCNFGQRPFAYAPPAGFKPLHTGTLPDPVITNPKLHFDVLTWNGNSVDGRSITGAAFAPDFLWAKRRSGVASHHLLVDTVRSIGAGPLRTLFSSSTGAEEITYGAANIQFGTVGSLISGGLTVAAGTNADPLAGINKTGESYAAWLWKAGGAPANNNNNGSITSQVSANPAAGFSIVTYTAPASGAFSVGHGLGVTPALIICKNRGGTGNWSVYHKVFPTSADYYLSLNLTNATVNNPSMWGAGHTSVLTGGNVGSSDAASQPMVRYCFAEIPGFSRFGSYIGNNSANGPFVYCGFRPRFILLKRTDSAADWFVVDTTRNTVNPLASYLLANTSGAEVTTSLAIDTTANGFKIRVDGSSWPAINPSGGTVIFMALAEAPFKSALAR